MSSQADIVSTCATCIALYGHTSSWAHTSIQVVQEIARTDTCAGTLEEKIFQRQLSKEGLSNVVNQSGKSSASLLSSEDLADLFTPEFDSLSSTYEGMVEADLNKGASGRWVEMTQEQKAAPVLREQVGCAACMSLTCHQRCLDGCSVSPDCRHRYADINSGRQGWCSC